MDSLPLLELFTRLREAGLPLGIPDYEAAVRSVQKGYGLPDRAALARLCQTLWVRSPDEQRLFDYYFEQLIGSTAGSPPEKIVDSAMTNASKRYPAKHIALYAGLIGALVIGTGIILWIKTQPSKVLIAPIPSPAPQIPTTQNPAASAPPPSPKPQPASPPKSSNPSNNWIWLMLLILALGAGTFWLVKFLMKRRSQIQSLPPEADIPDRSAKMASELLRQTNDTVQVAQAVQQLTNKGKKNTSDRFILSGDYLPVTQRQMKQSWRHLRRMVREGPATELDVARTVQRIARDGMLLNPVLIPRRTNRTELVLLIDQDGSMVPFHSLSARLVETALRGGRLGKAGAYYFHNCPIDYLYHDPMHQEDEPIEDVFRGFNRDRTIVLIFSDAGAARGGLSLERAVLTTKFLQPLQQRVRYVAWLNPMPKSRWATSTAREIAHAVPMFEATRQGLDEAINTLRGRHQPLVTRLEGVK